MWSDDGRRGHGQHAVSDLPARLPRPHGTPLRRREAATNRAERTTGAAGRTLDLRALVRIAQVAPLYEAVPPGAYGGTERVIATLCDGLVAQGHEVTLFAPETSETDAVLEAYGEPLRTRFSREELVDLAPHLHLQMLADLYRREDEFDVVHSHLDIWT